MFDFSDPDAARSWAPIDDRVMGGVSRSRWRHAPAGHAVFEGDVSLAQGGGFASVRSGAAHRGRAGAQACRVEARGDEELEYEGEIHTAANLYDALKEGYYGKL